MKKYHYTYMVNDTENGMSYIGVRSSNTHPLEDNYMGSSKYLSEAILAKGLQYFTKTILALWPTRLHAIEHEIALHSYFDVAKNPLFYNKANQKSSGFDTCQKRNPLSEETKEKIRLSSLGKKMSEESRKKMSLRKKGKKLSEKHIKALIHSNKNRVLSEESKQKMREKALGRKHSEETKKKISDYQQARRV